VEKWGFHEQPKTTLQNEKLVGGEPRGTVKTGNGRVNKNGTYREVHQFDEIKESKTTTGGKGDLS